jgi:uncharacterized protein (UPF0548 family)
MPERPALDTRARAALAARRERGASFQPGDAGSFTAEHGWRVDDYRQPLGAEPPGDPVPGGRWEAAKRLVQDYEFADPKIIRAVYEQDAPLEGRDMLLEARFWGLRFHFGVRVGDVLEEVREVEGRQVRSWGWNYRTLTGHFEMGQMDFEVWKWTDTGEIEFRIHSVSRPGRIPNPIVRAGFRLFGRGQQLKFCRHACERMRRLTDERAEAGAATRLSHAVGG